MLATWSGTKGYVFFKDSGGFVLVPDPRGRGGQTFTLNLNITIFPMLATVRCFLFISSAGSLGQPGSNSKPLSV